MRRPTRGKIFCEKITAAQRRRSLLFVVQISAIQRPESLHNLLIPKVPKTAVYTSFLLMSIASAMKRIFHVEIFVRPFFLFSFFGFGFCFFFLPAVDVYTETKGTS